MSQCPECRGPHVSMRGTAHFDGCSKWDALNRAVRPMPAGDGSAEATLRELVKAGTELMIETGGDDDDEANLIPVWRRFANALARARATLSRVPAPTGFTNDTR